MRRVSFATLGLMSVLAALAVGLAGGTAPRVTRAAAPVVRTARAPSVEVPTVGGSTCFVSAPDCSLVPCREFVASSTAVDDPDGAVVVPRTGSPAAGSCPERKSTGGATAPPAGPSLVAVAKTEHSAGVASALPTALVQATVRLRGDLSRRPVLPGK